MAGFDQFKSYEKFQSLTYDELKLAVNYICSNLNCSSYNLSLLVRYVLLYLKVFYCYAMEKRKRI